MIDRVIKAIIVDDEPKCISNLQYYISTYCPQVEVVATGKTLSDALNSIKETFDVAFLDIEIEQDNIFDLLSEAETDNFDIVFVTAYDRYALSAFDVDVLDYVLKPLSKKNILNCYNKLLRRFQPVAATSSVQEGNLPLKNIILKQGKNVYAVAYSDIIYFEAHGIYTNVYFHYENRKHCVTVSKSISQLQAMYQYDNFFRVHRSFLINTMKIKNIVREETLGIKMCTDDYIPVAKRRMSEFLSTVKISH